MLNSWFNLSYEKHQSPSTWLSSAADDSDGEHVNDAKWVYFRAAGPPIHSRLTIPQRKSPVCSAGFDCGAISDLWPRPRDGRHPRLHLYR